MIARIIEPGSKPGSARVLEEAGVVPASYPTVWRRLRVHARDSWRQKLSAACAAYARLGPATLVLYDLPADLRLAHLHPALARRADAGVDQECTRGIDMGGSRCAAASLAVPR